MLFREIDQYISNFFATSKMALLLTGARQTGKTYAARKFGKTFEQYIEINFIESPDAVAIFKGATKASEILLRISAYTQKNIIKDKTLIFLDEVQVFPEIITAIKFLVDEGSCRYALSGSLLGVELSDIKSQPVGYMGIKEVFPLDFKEFIFNLGISESIINRIKENWKALTPVDEVIHSKLLELFRLYTIIGGMPAAVQAYIESNDINVVMQTQLNIIALYRKDISQYAERDKLKIKEVFDLIPSELDSKNKRFILKNLNEHAKFDRYANSFLWLSNAGVAIPVFNISQPTQPLKLSEQRNLFKLFSNDVGLLAAQYADGIQLRILTGDIDVNFGAVFENAIAQELLAHNLPPYFYNNKKFGEVDFIISYKGEILPIEVKSGKDYKRHNALSNLLKNPEYQINSAIVLCQGNVEIKDNIQYLPIYMCMFLKKDYSNPGIFKIDLSALK